MRQETYTLISYQDALVRVRQRLDYYRKWLQCPTISRNNPAHVKIWAGYTSRVEALEITKSRILSGLDCSRAMAQLFCKGYRISYTLRRGESVRATLSREEYGDLINTQYALLLGTTSQDTDTLF